ncbi:hypothetical protein, partial [Bittarella massiliensis (ex Durand et al. 2017)]
MLSKKAKVFIETERVEVFSQGEEFIKRLASASEVAVAPQLELEGMVMAITAEAKIGMPMDDGKGLLRGGGAQGAHPAAPRGRR